MGDVWGRLRAELCGFRAGFLGGHSRLLKLKSCQNHSGWFWSLRLPFKSAPPPALLLQAAFPITSQAGLLSEQIAAQDYLIATAREGVLTVILL